MRAHEEACEGVEWEYRKEEEETFNEEREEGRENKAHRLLLISPHHLGFCNTRLVRQILFHLFSLPKPLPALQYMPKKVGIWGILLNGNGSYYIL